MGGIADHALLVLISAPSGAGKTTLCRHLLAAHPELTRVITCTTRPPRDGEREGEDYFFVTAADFEAKVKAGAFLEHAQVYGQRYGTPRSEVMGKLSRGQDVLLNVDVQGAGAIQAAAAVEEALKRSLVTVFLTPPSLAELEARLRRRGTEGESILRERLGAARREIARWRTFDYLVISTTMVEDLRRLEVIVEAERMRQSRAASPEMELAECR